MKYLDLIKSVQIEDGLNEILLDGIYPIADFDQAKFNKVEYFIDDELNMDSKYANRLMIDSKEMVDLNIYCGQGYIASKDDEMTNKFLRFQGWSGGDGIYSFNLTDGNDQFDQKQDMKTLFVFGDTFVGTSDLKTNQRFQPHLMPNNSLGYYQDQKIEFKVNFKDDGSVAGFYSMDPQYDNAGTVIQNIIRYDRKDENPGYVSGYYPKDLEIVFDLYKIRNITHIDFYNYFSNEEKYLAKRGLKEVEIHGSLNGETYTFIKKINLSQSEYLGNHETIEIHESHRFIKLIVPTKPGVGNHNDDTFTEGLFALNQVKFYNLDQQYRDLKVDASSTLLINPEHSWIWLQDGVIIGDHLYFIPMVINSDLNQPEGLQFCVKGVALFKTPIENKDINYEKATQKMAPLLVENEESQWLFGAAIMASTRKAGSKNPDGFIYIYGYKTTMGLREMVLARVLEENFEYFDDWTFFDGNDFQPDIFKSVGLLSHISCEMSVSPILDGLYKDKYLAVFTYDVNTKYVSYAIGESPWGPFSKPQKIYVTPEQEIYKSTTYTYNAKAHPHLSMSTDVLVSYNTNTYNFDHNMSNNLVYRPRFIRLKDTTK
ncbi:hypothetical protein [Peloplasma aerotolerans]|uniref:DUF4185 domain-containing protein n=1 Tax=Peloplasma aerotolerans TaxID=3044389 RepID=A0AAW6U8X8_9MOLU|nr:hypothetical protein [Mariniplasma sp. M4Ah]MDI6453119.1 hypothetical protein [Mariniplasma sp. M4Ah]